MKNISYFKHDIKSVASDNKKMLSAWIDAVLKKQKKSSYDIAFIFSTDEYVLHINQQFLQHDFFTDIITFDYSSPKHIESEIYISVDRVKENAKNFNVPFKQELHRVIIHGVLHLCGFKDKSGAQKKLMQKKEDECLQLLATIKNKKKIVSHDF